MSWKRSAETSWDSDDDILKDDNEFTSGISAFPISPENKRRGDSDDELDENALLYSDDNDSVRNQLHGTKKSSNATAGKIKLSSNKPKSWSKITAPSHEPRSDGRKTFTKITGPSSQDFNSASNNSNALSAEKEDEFGAVLEIDPEEENLFDESAEASESAPFLNASVDSSIIDNETQVMYEEDLSQSNTDDFAAEDNEDNSVLEETMEETFEEEKPALSDSESESDEEEKGRGRFKTERSISKSVTVPTVAKAKPRDAIPDTLEISEEQQAQIEEFMTQGKGGRGRGRGRGIRGRGGRGGGPQNRYQPYQQQPPPQNQQVWPNHGPPNEMHPPSQYPYPQHTQQMPPQQSAPPYHQEPHAAQPHLSHPPVSMPHSSNAPVQMPPATVSQPQPRKILINPHFRGRSQPSTANSHAVGVSGGSYTGPQMPAPHVVNSHQPQPLLAPHQSPQHNPSHVSGWPPHSPSTRPPYPVHNPSPQTGNFNPPYQGGVRPQHHYPSGPPSSMYQGSQPHPHHPAPQPLMQNQPAAQPFGGPHHRGPAPFHGDPRIPVSNAPPHQQYPPPQNTGYHMPRHQQPHPQSLLGAPPPGMPYQSPNNQHFNAGGPQHQRLPPPHMLQNNQPRGHGPQQHSGPPRMQQRMPPPPHGHQPRPLMSQNFQSQMRPQIRPQNNQQQFNTKSKISAQQLRIQSQKLKERAKKFKQSQQQQQNLKAVPSDSGIQSISTVINRVGQKRHSTDATDSSPTKVAKQGNVDPETQRALDEQKRRREEIVRMKEERRQAQAAQKRKQLEEKLKSQGLTIEDLESGKVKPEAQGQAKTPPSNQQLVSGPNEQVQWRYGAPINQTRPAGLKPFVQQGIRMQRPVGQRAPGPRPQNMSGPRNPQPAPHQQQGARLSGPRPQQTSPKAKGPGTAQTSSRLVNSPIANQNNNAPIAEGMVRRKKVTILKKNAKGEVIDRQIIWKPFNENEIVNSVQRIVANTPAAETANTSSSQRTVVANKSAPETASNQRTVVANTAAPDRVVMRSGSAGGQRKVVDNQPRRVVVGGETPGSKTVVINNLSASTPEVKLRSMAEEIGPIEEVKQFKASKKAHITFVNPQHAADFVKKYHRHLIDLSSINVTLLT